MEIDDLIERHQNGWTFSIITFSVTERYNVKMSQTTIFDC